jgi:hypothetical protein
MSDDLDDPATLRRLLDDAKGRALAAARDRDEIKRNAEKTLKEAQAYREEADNVIATAMEQLQIANAISMGVYALGQWANAIVANKSLAARILYREEKTWCELAEGLCNASDSKNQIELDRLSKETRKRLGIVRGNKEALRLELIEDWQAMTHKDVKAKIDLLMQGE